MFKNVISLGYFCSVARQMEKYGLRCNSYPFDWLITEWECIEKAFELHFDGFLDYENLCQMRDYPERYKNELYNCWFFHDFNKYESLKVQLPSVQEKYSRRIERFFTDITYPSLFIRYVKSAEEFYYLEENIDRISNMFKQYNQENELLLIANEGLTSDKMFVLNAVPDEGRRNAEFFADKCSNISDYFNSEIISTDQRVKNLKFYDSKLSEKSSFSYRLSKKVSDSFNKFKKVYYHDKYIYWDKKNMNK